MRKELKGNTKKDLSIAKEGLNGGTQMNQTKLDQQTKKTRWCT